MRFTSRLWPPLLAWAFGTGPLTAQEPLTLDRVLALARERGPRLLAARARTEEARGRLGTASVLFRENPVLEVAAGSRDTAQGRSTDREWRLGQTLELGRRGPRIAAARADLAREGARSEDVQRILLREVAASFLRALHGQERVRLADSSVSLAAETLAIARRRYEAGDVAVLDVNLTQAAHARARSERQDAEAVELTALLELRVGLGMPPDAAVLVAGTLGVSPPASTLSDLLARVDDRPDIRALAAEVQQAEAELRLGRALARPELGLAIEQRREGGDQIVMGGLTVRLPVFDRGQGFRTEAAARLSRARAEFQAASQAAAAELQTAYEMHQLRTEAAQTLERDAAALIEENEALARRSYEVGQIGLGELLLIRRETVETRRAFLDARLAAAIAAIEVRASAGVLP